MDIDPFIAVRIRIIIPPNLESSAQRDAIPTKLEFELDNGQVLAPEKADMQSLGSLDEAGRVAAFSLLQWCNGSLSSFLQLTKEQLAQLILGLQGAPSFFWANKPKAPIEWNVSELIGVSEFLVTAEKAAAPSSVQAPRPQGTRPPSTEAEDEPPRNFHGTPMVIDGSSHFLSISLPSREHPYYPEIRELLNTHRFKLEPRNRRWWLRDRHLTLNFLGEYWDDLKDRYAADFTENFLSRVKGIREARIRTEIAEERNGYTVNLSISAGQASPQAISQSLNTGRHYIESDDQVYLIKKNRIDSLHTLQKSLSESPDAPLLHNGNYKIPITRTPEVEENIVALNPNFKPPATWRARSIALNDRSKLKAVPLPEQLEATLRPYQKIGVSWLKHLFTHQLGGILADEMGLGKTLQALALLANLKTERTPQSPRLSLVVCPASLVENWRREAAKFCPQLKVFVNHGAQRIAKTEELRDIDLIVTSYGTLIRDQKRFASLDFLCVIGDEAQHIKNRRTRNAKAIASLQTQGRILLTGTPVENSIQDLMSLLDFIMPGGWKGIPSGARAEDRRWHEERIRDQAAPYILRRSKKNVAPELPEKLEQIVFVKMTDAQKQVYEQAKRFAENEIADMEKNGASEGAVRMKTLTQLLRLRQTCCDPRLLDKSLEADSSAKRASFLELLEEAIDGGHRILVFSQFVSILSLLKEELEQQSIDYCYIDGSTRNRMAQVDRFQDNDNIPIFLISLKAGGTGLNLTGADTVIHFDPWWNPAAEAQATDRAHRIGQSKVVTSYKLIVADSVEEKVLHMQNQKRKLLEDIFDASEAANAKISLGDLKELL